MTNPKFSAMRTAVRGTFDRRLVGGMIIGAAIMISAMATAAPDSNGSWFSGMFNTGSSTTTGNASQDLLTQQESVISGLMQDEPCDIKKAVEVALSSQMQLARATPNVESLFDINDDCFSTLASLPDLSDMIPSLGSIINAAKAAALKYAQKKVCTAVNKVSGMVVNPINQAIGTINTMPGFGDINGMVNSQVGGALSTIDPDLGAQYHPPAAAGTYTININPFNATQTGFETEPGATPGAGQINNDIAAINALTTRIAEQQNKSNQSQWDLQAAQSNYSSCDSHNNNCSAAAAAVTAAERTLAQDQALLASLNQQLSQMRGRAAAPAAVSAPAAQSRTAAASAPQAEGSFWSNVSSLFK